MRPVHGVRGMCWVWCACCSMCTLLAHPRALQQLHVILFRRSDRLEPPPRPGSCLCRHACCCDERCWRWTRVTSRTAITGRSAVRRCRGRCRRSPESCAAYRNDTDWAADCVPHRDRPKREDHVIPADSRILKHKNIGSSFKKSLYKSKHTSVRPN